FRTLWDDQAAVNHILTIIKDRFRQASEAEARAWEQDWSTKSTQDLVGEIRCYFDLVMASLGTMYISNPQHVLPLDEKLNALLEGNPERDLIVSAATSFSGQYPWTEEDDEIAGLRDQWERRSVEEQDAELDGLVRRYGWFNEIEGDRPFDRE